MYWEWCVMGIWLDLINGIGKVENTENVMGMLIGVILGILGMRWEWDGMDVLGMVGGYWKREDWKWEDWNWMYWDWDILGILDGLRWMGCTGNTGRMRMLKYFRELSTKETCRMV